MRVGAVSARRAQAAVSAAGQPLCIAVQLHKSGQLFAARQTRSIRENAGLRLFSFVDSLSWWIADWLVYDESEFHERYEETIKRTSLELPLRQPLPGPGRRPTRACYISSSRLSTWRRSR
jgi:hypothetical protein